MLIYFYSMNENEISKIIVEEAVWIHRNIGPGLLESVYCHLMVHRLTIRGLKAKTQVAVPVVFDGVRLECGYRADIVVEGKVVIEVKSVEGIIDLHIAQTLTYLRFLNLKRGLILNFKTVLMKNGIRRVVRNL